MAKTFTAPFAQTPKTATAVVTGAIGSITTDAPTGTVELMTAGSDGAILTRLTAIPDETDRRMAQIEWEYAQTIDRNSTWVSNLADSLGLSDDQLDDLFTAASTI